jgi:hypothetical protein
VLPVGYRWENNWRIELEGGWRENEVDCVDFGFGGGCVPGNFGDVSQFTHMINVIHDIPLSRTTALSIGLGLGGNFVDVDVPALWDDDSLRRQALVNFRTADRAARFRPDLSLHGERRSRVPRVRPIKIDYENENHTVSVGCASTCRRIRRR